MRKNKESSSKNKTTVSKKWTVVVSCWLLAGSGNHCPRISLLNPDETGVHNGPFAILFLQNHLAALVHEPEQDDRSIHFWVKDNLFCFRVGFILPVTAPVSIVNVSCVVYELLLCSTVSFGKSRLHDIILAQINMIISQKSVQQFFVLFCQIDHFFPFNMLRRQESDIR